MYIVNAYMVDKSNNGNGEHQLIVEHEITAWHLLNMLEDSEMCKGYVIFCTVSAEYVKDIEREFNIIQIEYKKFKKTYSAFKRLMNKQS